MDGDSIRTIGLGMTAVFLAIVAMRRGPTGRTLPEGTDETSPLRGLFGIRALRRERDHCDLHQAWLFGERLATLRVPDHVRATYEEQTDLQVAVFNALRRMILNPEDRHDQDLAPGPRVPT